MSLTSNYRRADRARLIFHTGIREVALLEGELWTAPFRRRVTRLREESF